MNHEGMSAVGTSSADPPRTATDTMVPAARPPRSLVDIRPPPPTTATHPSNESTISDQPGDGELHDRDRSASAASVPSNAIPASTRATTTGSTTRPMTASSQAAYTNRAGRNGDGCPAVD